LCLETGGSAGEQAGLKLRFRNLPDLGDRRRVISGRDLSKHEIDRLTYLRSWRKKL
jgi:hypothetical protein